jgi:mRNA interferase HigB
VNIITKPTIIYYANKYPVASNALLTWYRDFSRTSFNTFNELKEVYSAASIVANSRIIFNIKGNAFRLIMSINFKKQAAYVIWFGTHKEYDKINAETIDYIKV